MKTFTIILVVLVVIIAIPLLVALFVKKDYIVQRNIVIGVPQQQVFDYIKLLKNQDHYNKWVMTDPGMKKEFRGTDGTVGFVYAWNGNNKAGEGEQEIMNLVDGERMDVEIRFKRPFESTGRAPFTLQPVDETQTRVTWRMEGRSKWPMNIMNLFIDKVLGHDMEESLHLLKNNLENQ